MITDRGCWILAGGRALFAGRTPSWGHDLKEISKLIYETIYFFEISAQKIIVAEA